MEFYLGVTIKFFLPFLLIHQKVKTGKATLFELLGTRVILELIFRTQGVGKINKNEKELKMFCVREGKVRLSVSKVHICYDNTLFSITFEPVVRF